MLSVRTLYEHIPRAITLGLRLRGIDILTVQEDTFSWRNKKPSGIFAIEEINFNYCCYVCTYLR